MKRDIGKDEYFLERIPVESYFDLTTPYGYGGFILKGMLQEMV